MKAAELAWRRELWFLRFEDSGRIAVIDSGMGKNWSDKELHRYRVDLHVPGIGEALESIGISKDEVTDAAMTHLHFDHAGGWLERGSGGELKPVFANAMHHVQKKQWHWAENPSVKDKGSFFFDDLACIAKAGLLNLLDGSQEIFLGLDVITLDGHTPGFQIPVVTGKKGENRVSFRSGAYRGSCPSRMDHGLRSFSAKNH